MAIFMTIDDVRRTILPAPAHPRAAMVAAAPITFRPDIFRPRTRGRGDDHFRRRCWSYQHHRRRRRHGEHRHGQAERKAEMNSGLGRQAGRTDQRGCEKQFSFHKFHFLLHGVIAIQAMRRRFFRDVTRFGCKSGPRNVCTVKMTASNRPVTFVVAEISAKSFERFTSRLAPSGKAYG
jgi:hypothetical protein